MAYRRWYGGGRREKEAEGKRGGKEGKRTKGGSSGRSRSARVVEFSSLGVQYQRPAAG